MLLTAGTSSKGVWQLLQAFYRQVSISQVSVSQRLCHNAGRSLFHPVVRVLQNEWVWGVDLGFPTC